jgi:hypothetical protein
MLVVCLFAGAHASAHHTAAGFDAARQLTLTGRVREFQWRNPHSYIQLIVVNRNGAEEEWSIEMAAPMYLLERGWVRSSLKSGDRITVTIRPLRNGSRGGLAMEVLDARGAPIGRSS